MPSGAGRLSWDLDRQVVGFPRYNLHSGLKTAGTAMRVLRRWLAWEGVAVLDARKRVP